MQVRAAKKRGVKNCKIVSLDWLEDSINARRKLPEKEFMLAGIVRAEKAAAREAKMRRKKLGGGLAASGGRGKYALLLGKEDDDDDDTRRGGSMFVFSLSLSLSFVFLIFFLTSLCLLSRRDFRHGFIHTCWG